MSIVKDLLLVVFFFGIVVNYILLYKKMLKQQKYFVETLSHDLRVSTLAQFRGLELLQKVSKNELTDNIMDSCKYTLDMINMLLSTYRFESGENVLNYEYFKLSKLISDSCNYTKNLANEKDIEFVYEFQNNDCIEADESFLFKALTIILSVSVFNADRRSKIDCSFQKKQGKWSIMISYSGQPLTDEECRRMFSNNPRFSTVGHGIKMYLCKKIVEFHCGKVKVINSSERNNSFVVQLPEYKKRKSSKMESPSLFQCVMPNYLCKKS